MEQDAKERVDEAKREMKQEVMARKRLALDLLLPHRLLLGPRWGIKKGQRRKRKKEEAKMEVEADDEEAERMIGTLVRRV